MAARYKLESRDKKMTTNDDEDRRRFEEVLRRRMHEGLRRADTTLRRRLERGIRGMTSDQIDAVVSTVACPNRRCGAKIGEPCRGINLPHVKRIHALNRHRRGEPIKPVEDIPTKKSLREEVITAITRRMGRLASELEMWELSEAERQALFARLDEAMDPDKKP